jgi:hypothetical protein
MLDDKEITYASTGKDERLRRSKGDLVHQVDRLFDEVVQNEIVENARVLVGAFQQLAEQAIPPTKATAEFGLKLTAAGDVYIVKASSEASFKIVLEWQMPTKANHD